MPAKHLSDITLDINELIKYCQVCKRLFLDVGDFKSQSSCHKAKVQIDFRGRTFLSHTASKNFLFLDFLSFLENDRKT